MRPPRKVTTPRRRPITVPAVTTSRTKKDGAEIGGKGGKSGGRNGAAGAKGSVRGASVKEAPAKGAHGDAAPAKPTAADLPADVVAA